MIDALIVNLDGVLIQVDLSTKFGQFSVDKTDFETLSGWSLKPEGLCKGAVCVPVINSQLLSDGMSIDLIEFSRIVNQNIVVDIHGKQVSFSDFNRRKRLLLAWSSW